MAKLVDTNLIIRFLIKDNLSQFEAAKKIFISSNEDLILPDLSLAETVWVMESAYRLTKDEIVVKLLEFLKLKNLKSNYYLLTDSLLLFQNYNISFIDAYLVAYSEQEKLEGIYSFDKGFVP